MRIISAEYLTSARSREGLLNDNIPQIAIAGRSNVGKSSFINFITDNSKLCRTSGAPGRTRMINYFLINRGAFYFTDLPGYGYAKASNKEINEWARFISDYFNYTDKILNVFALMDLRLPPQESDIKLINMLNSMNIGFTVIGTKADKLSRAKINKSVAEIATALKIGTGNIIVTSSAKKTGREEALNRIERLLEINQF
ncbi:MAG: ribosome biogenesis GTP-binding protein YihA/YsxC [Christensenellales bacterium]|jgi:GTP-binding protein